MRVRVCVELWQVLIELDMPWENLLPWMADVRKVCSIAGYYTKPLGCHRALCSLCMLQQAADNSLDQCARLTHASSHVCLAVFQLAFLHHCCTMCHRGKARESFPEGQQLIDVLPGSVC